MRRWLSVPLAALALAGAVAPPGGAAEQAQQGSGYAATIRYTEYGVPRVLAPTFAGAGYGYGYAVAKDNICALAENYVTVAGERGRYFGEKDRLDRAFGSPTSNVTSDLRHRQIRQSGVVAQLIGERPPYGPKQELRDLVRGYVAGYNRYLRDTGVDRITDPACRGAAWVRPITETDFYHHFYALVTMTGQSAQIDPIVAAQPPASQNPQAVRVPGDAAETITAALAANTPMGSNSFAVGPERTANGRALLLGHPHFPWPDGRRLYQAQITVPGQLNVTGANPIGIPGAQMGYTEHVAWTHTVSTARTYGVFQLNLVPGDPTSYLVDGKPEKMTATTVETEVRGADGTLTPVRRTLWGTRYGPVLTSMHGVALPWTASTAYAFRDANAANVRGLNTWLEIGQARSTHGIKRALEAYQGVPWVNTIAVDSHGNTLFSDIQVVPHVTDELAARCNTELGKAIFAKTRIPVLDGSRTSCAWGQDPTALQPGTFGPGRLPSLARKDYVTNENDSHWLVNPHQPLTGFPTITGFGPVEQGPRLRQSVTVLEGSRKLDIPALEKSLTANESFTGKLVKPDLARLCAALPDGKAPSSGGPVEAGPACAATRSWDGAFTTGSRGALLFQRFLTRLRAAGPVPWTVPFSAADPIRTPNTLDIANPVVAKAFGDAIADLDGAGIDPATPLGQVQYLERSGQRIPIPGAPDAFGVLNLIDPVWDPKRGNTGVGSGTSYVNMVSFDGDRCPSASTLIAHGQSGDPTSPHHTDQTRLFAEGRWVRGRLCESEVLSSPGLRITHLLGR